MDLSTSETVHRPIFGQNVLGEGAYALMPNGNPLCHRIGWAVRACYLPPAAKN